jgi:hypothetical protein
LLLVIASWLLWRPLNIKKQEVKQQDTNEPKE